MPKIKQSGLKHQRWILSESHASGPLFLWVLHTMIFQIIIKLDKSLETNTFKHLDYRLYHPETSKLEIERNKHET